MDVPDFADIARISQILLYQTEDGRSRIEVRLEGETVRLSQGLMAELFQTTKQNISLHIHNIFKEGELEELSVVKEYLTTASDGKRYKIVSQYLDFAELQARGRKPIFSPPQVSGFSFLAFSLFEFFIVKDRNFEV
jgi:hypothetical protein